MDLTLLKGLKVLETLAYSDRPRGVSDLASEMDLPKSNIHRTLQTLISAGYVRSEHGSSLYRCTLKVFEMASAVVSRIDVRGNAEPLMQVLGEQTRETIHLSVLDQLDVIYLHKVESPQPVRAYSTIGGRAPAYCVASGKSLLAHQSEQWLRQLPQTLRMYTSETLTDADDLRREFARVRMQGYAVNRGEWRETVGGVATIVRDVTGQPVAAIGVSGPIDRMRSNLEQHIPLVISAGRETSKLLGCRNYDATTPMTEG